MRLPSSPPDRRRDGFTIIELVIVVVIIGVLAAVAVPQFHLVALRAEAAEAPPILRQICTLAHAVRNETGAWPAPVGEAGLDAVPGLGAVNPRQYEYSYSLDGEVGRAHATPRPDANPRLAARSMDCASKTIP